MNDVTIQRRFSLLARIALGVLLGLGCGILLGDLCSPIKWVGDVYVGLLQMTVLPYIVVSLIANIGRLSYRDGPRMAFVGLCVMLILWLIAIIVLAAMTFSFPAWETGSFYSTSFVDEPPAPNWLDLFIPSNPFRSMAEGAVPAVVVFSIGVGISLMAMPFKDQLLVPLSTMAETLAQLNKLMVRFSPIGMFAIVAHAVGTIELNQLALIQGYLVTYGAATLLLVFWILPACVSAVTPLSTREVISASSNALVSTFVIGNSFVVLPMIIDSTSRLMKEHNSRTRDDHEPEYLVPTAYPFPDVGRLVGLIFIWFSAWFYGTSIDGVENATVLGVGFLGSFGKPVVTIPLLLNLADLPSDIFGLYLASGVLAARFGDLMKAMHLITFTIVTSYALSGSLSWNTGKVLSRMAIAVGLLGCSIVATREYLHYGFVGSYAKDQLITQRTPMIPIETNPFVWRTAVPNPDPIREGQTRLDRIRERGCIRIGYLPNKLPFSYRNSHGLVGLDIDMAHQLAIDLGVRLEFVPLDERRIIEQLDSDCFDIAMTGIEASIHQASTLPSVGPYMEVTPAVVLPDYRKSQLRDIQQYQKKSDLVLAVVAHGYSSERIEHVLPNAKIIRLANEAEYFAGVYLAVDGLVTNAETGSAWTLTHPDFSVVNPLGGQVRVPLYYATKSDHRFQQFLQNWIELQRTNGNLQTLYQYWILGKDASQPLKSRSILRDVFGYEE